jgi:hypothetical protein
MPPSGVNAHGHIGGAWSGAISQLCGVNREPSYWKKQVIWPTNRYTLPLDLTATAAVATSTPGIPTPRSLCISHNSHPTGCSRARTVSGETPSAAASWAAASASSSVAVKSSNMREGSAPRTSGGGINAGMAAVATTPVGALSRPQPANTIVATKMYRMALHVTTHGQARTVRIKSPAGSTQTGGARCASPRPP